MADKTILVIGTWDTKAVELGYLSDRIESQGGRVLGMDVGVLGEVPGPMALSRHDVAAEGGASIREAIDAGDENHAMQIMARGAAALALRLWREGRFDGMIALGGSMGTDLALDVARALPVGVPKYVVSTIAFSPLLPPERLAPDIQMILWAGGLSGLNPVCRASLSQAAGAVLGAARAVEPPRGGKPLVGMTSLGASALRYMIPLKPALEARGFEVAIFHATGMGGRAFESLAAEGAFACVMDFCTQELGNHLHGSSVSAGPDRLTNAGRAGVPQIVAPGCYDLVDVIGWHPLPAKWAGHPTHAHNRLITSVVLGERERAEVARAHHRQLATATGPVTLLVPERGFGEWDRPGAPLNDPAGLDAFLAELTRDVPGNVEMRRLDCHINDDAFAEAALAVFDQWLAEGIVMRPDA